jgi:uncharacterized protein (UPF0332 family)
MLAADWPDEAGRAAYLAALHAAQAVIVERTGRIVKRHRGVRNELWRLLRDEPRFDGELRGFLGRAYNLKAIADYGTEPDSPISVELARAAIETAHRYVEVVVALLT